MDYLPNRHLVRDPDAVEFVEDFMKQLKFNVRRYLLLVPLLPAIFCVANYMLDLGVFGQFDKKVAVISVVILALWTHFLGPTLREVEDRHAKNQHGKFE